MDERLSEQTARDMELGNGFFIIIPASVIIPFE